MRSRLSLLGGHPVHVMVVPFAMAPFAILVLLDLLPYAGFSVGADAGLAVAVFGLAATLVAILTGLVDLAAIPDDVPAHRTAAFHFVGGLAILAAYAGTAWMRWQALGSDGLLLGVDLVGSGLVAVQGWLGGELTVRHRIGILEDEEGADPVDLG